MKQQDPLSVIDINGQDKNSTSGVPNTSLVSFNNTTSNLVKTNDSIMMKIDKADEAARERSLTENENP